MHAGRNFAAAGFVNPWIQCVFFIAGLQQAPWYGGVADVMELKYQMMFKK